MADSGFKVPFYREVERLGWRSRRTMEKQPFAIDAVGILPDHQPDCFSEESVVTIGKYAVIWPMMDCHLPAEELAELRVAHRGTRDKREADRIKVVVLLANDWEADDVADALLVESSAVRNQFKAYRARGLLGLVRLAYRGSERELSKADLNALDAHVQANLNLSAKDAAAWVEAQTHTSGARTASFVTGGGARPRSGAQTRSPFAGLPARWQDS